MRVVKKILFLYFLFSCKNLAFAVDDEVLKLKEEFSYKIVKKSEKKEIEKFASWFHQDWQMIFSSFNEGKNQYVNGLTVERKAVLKQELELFIETNKALSDKGVLNEWIKLGAQGWDSNIPIYDALKSFSESL